MRTILEHARKYGATMDLHSCRVARDSLKADATQLNSLIEALAKEPVTEVDQQLIDDFTVERDDIQSVIDVMEKRFEVAP